jgi:DNA-binding NarL/FixJ family response regulator
MYVSLPLRMLWAEEQRMIRILLVDDQAIVRQGWTMRFALEPDIVVVGQAGNGREAIALATALQPDVVVMDVEMPVMDGIAALEELRGLPVAAIIMSIHDNAEVRARAQAAGARAFIGKQEPFETLLSAIRRING